MTDLVLSSGFLAFARHLGFLEAVVAHGVAVDAVCGTSSGAMVGALYAAGHGLPEIAAELSASAPLANVGWKASLWRGLLSLDPIVARLRTKLPATFEELPLPLGVGVVGPNGHELLTSGPLPEAIAASCAMPFVFQPVFVGGRPYSDGGAADRLGLAAWRRWRGDRPGIAHWVERTAGKDVEHDLAGVDLVRTPRSGARLWDLGDFSAQIAEARALSATALAALAKPTPSTL